ncbi:zinc finger protein 804B isoform X2 [Ambystoma mexicanum]|uniref:zinc finger protein 804B isoform X2 n=1 Tax=Ambystoma mexicanum TaxID=8296 RepID=UPI0037E7B252
MMGSGKGNSRGQSQMTFRKMPRLPRLNITLITITKQGYAEKEKAIANALEDLKANFYCELCDKQYHKHQEFDNHINSYDHAHKQRLKELKQREFARNVASKSWKDEKKQEKALKRLHQLAELRKQSECVSRGEPIFKSSRVAIGQQLQAGIFSNKSGSGPGTRFIVTCEGHNTPSNISEQQQAFTLAVGSQVFQPLPDGNKVSHRAGVSFCFSKKAQLKLESSASVFNENSEEGTERKVSQSLNEKLAIDCFRTQAPLVEDPATHPSTTTISPEVQNGTNASINTATNTNISKEEDGNAYPTSELTVDLHNPKPKAKMHYLEAGGFGSHKESEQAEEAKTSERTLEMDGSVQCQTTSCKTQQNKFNKHSNPLLKESPDETPSETSATQVQAKETECNADVLNTAAGLKNSESLNRSEAASMREPSVNDVRPKALPFLHVVSKDGSTVLQWPTELLLFTKTQPTISYGCNPLYFDFKLSQNSKVMKGDYNSNENGPPVVQDRKGDSGAMQGKPMLVEKEDLSTEPKTHRLSQQNTDDCTNDEELACYGTAGSVKPLNADVPTLSPNFTFSEMRDCDEKSCHKRKRKDISPDQLSGNEGTLLNSASGQMSLPLANKVTKKHKMDRCAMSNSESSAGIPCQCESNQKPFVCQIDLNSSLKDSTEESLGDKACSHCRNSGYDSDRRCLEAWWRYSSAQRSPSSRHSIHSGASTSSSSASHSSTGHGHRSRERSTRSQCLLCCKKRHRRGSACKHRKHRPVSTSEEGVGFLFQTTSNRERKREEKKGIKKHKKSKKSSKHRHSQSKHGSKRRKSKHRLARRKHISRSIEQRSERSHSRNTISSERSLQRGSHCNVSQLFSKERGYYLKTDQATSKSSGEPPSPVTKEAALQRRCLKEPPCLGNDSEGLSESVIKENKAQESISLKGEPNLDTAQSEKVVLGTNVPVPKVNPDDSAVDLYNCPKGFFSVQHSASIDSTSMSPLHEKVSAVNTQCLKNSQVSALGSTEQKSLFEEPQEYKVTVTTHTDYENCHFNDIIRIGGEHQSLSADMHADRHEQSSPIINQVKPFMQSCDLLPNDFPCASPSNTYSVVTDSTETKEEQIRLQLRDVNMNSSPLEEQFNYYYDSAMQNCGDAENVFEAYNKISSPSLPQQPIGFSPEEIDQYGVLQMQAQQHMHTQLLSKHLKVFPVSGPATFSMTPSLHQIPVQQQQTSITTIHHTFLQRCALSASMRSHNTNFPLSHVHPLTPFTPVTFSHLAPAVLPTHATLLTGHPLHLFSAATIQPGQLTLQALPQTALIPTLFTPHLGTGTSSAIQLHPFIHPLFQEQEFQHHISNPLH